MVDHGTPGTGSEAGSAIGTLATMPARPNFIQLPQRLSFSTFSPTYTLAMTPTPAATSNDSEAGASTPKQRRLKPSTPMFDAPLHVLCVDDDPLTRTLMSRLLTRLGCIVTTAENGEIALELILGGTSFTPSRECAPISVDGFEQASSADGRYHIIFLDNQMPVSYGKYIKEDQLIGTPKVLTGVEAISRLRGLGRNDFVVGLTGSCFRESQKSID